MRLKSALLCITLAGCAAPAPERPLAEPPADATAAPALPAPFGARTYRSGTGIVESASVVSLASSPSAGGTGATMAYRVRLADGSLQDVVHAGERFEVGDRVEVMSDGRLLRR